MLLYDKITTLPSMTYTVISSPVLYVTNFLPLSKSIRSPVKKCQAVANIAFLSEWDFTALAAAVK